MTLSFATRYDRLRERRRQGMARVAFLDHVRTEPRRVFPPRLHVGWPETAQVGLAVTDFVWSDSALHTDLVTTLVHRVWQPGTRPPLVWLTRPGLLVRDDTDLAWDSAVRAASVELDLGLDFLLVTRMGWWFGDTDRPHHWRRGTHADAANRSASQSSRVA